MKMKRNLKRTISVVLTVLMILSTMIVGVVTVNAASISKGSSIYFKNTQDWESVEIYYWNDSTNGSYSMTLVDETEKIYKYTFESNFDYQFLFRENSNWNKQTLAITNYDKTKNLAICVAGSDRKNCTVNWDTYSGGEDPTQPTSSEPTPSTGVKIYFDNSSYNWSTVYAYVYDEEHYSTKVENTAWPGVTMRKDSTGLYYYEVPSNLVNGRVIFTESNNATTNRYPADGAQGLSIGNKSMIFTSGNSWNVYQGETEPTSTAPTKDKLSAGEKVYFQSSKELKSVELTINGGTEAVKMTSVGNVNAKFYYSYTLTEDARSFNFKTTDKSATPVVTDYPATYTDNNSNYNMFTDGKTWATFEIDKANAYTSGLWVDVAPEVKHSSVALIKWSNQYGPNGSLSSNTYNLYIPSGNTTDGKKTVPVYSKYSTLIINDTTVNQGDEYTFENGKSYTVKGNGTSYTMNVYISTSASVLLGTNKDMPTTPGTSKSDAKWVNGGFMTINDDGTVKDGLQTLVQIKGRGNSSWNISQQYMGKYAYNIKVYSKIDPLGMGATKAKSFCLLANNMDPSQLRNMVTYQMAENAKLPFVPNFKSVDLFDNGIYLGSYLITEKVDIGDSKLVHGETTEDYHNGAEDASTEGTYTYNGKSYKLHYTSNLDDIDATVYKNKSYLLEFDLATRAEAEACWFVTPQGKYVAFKAPEFATLAEVKYVAEKWAAVESAVYDGNYSKASKLIDMKSFAETYLIQEFTKNLDSGETSYYIYFDGTQGENTKWKATPIWDYDWALGSYANGKPIYTNGLSDTSNATTDLMSASGWFAKFKKFSLDEFDNTADRSEYLEKRNFQAQLANISEFWENDVKYVWNHGLKDSATTVFNTTIDEFYNENAASFNMNEKRWGFASNNPSTGWGTSTSACGTPESTKNYVKNYGQSRTTWMSNQLSSYVTTVYADPADFGNPDTLYAIVDGTAKSMEKITTEEDAHYGFFAVTVVKSSASDISFAVSNDGSTAIGATSTLTAGKDYHVSALGVTSEAATADCTSGHKPYVKVNLSNNSVNINTPVTVTSEVLRALSYDKVTGTDPSGNVVTISSDGTFTPTAAGDYTFKVKAKNYHGSASATATLTVTEQQETTEATTAAPTTEPATTEPATTEPVTTEPVTTEPTTTQPAGTEITNLNVKFKGTTLSYLVPSLEVKDADGQVVFAKTALTRTSDRIGVHFEGSYAFEWFSTTVNASLQSDKAYTFTFTTSGSKMSAVLVPELSGYASGSTIFVAVDNLHNGTEAVDITNNETAKTTYRTSVHMISNVDSTIQLARINLTTVNSSGTQTSTTYKLGDVNRDNKLNIMDATTLQLKLAELENEEENDSTLGDFNVDGDLNVGDATTLQLSLASMY